MRRREYLSHSAVKMFYDDTEQFFIRYLSEERCDNEPQTQPMSIGSAFDAYAKSYLHGHLFGKNHKHSAEFEFDTLFPKQVESQHRDWALEHGRYVWACYRDSGALADLLLDLSSAIGEPRFEIELVSRISTVGGDEQIPLLGKPDIFFINNAGCPVIIDWKVNGYCSKSPPSPKPGFLKIRSTDQSKCSGEHKNAKPGMFQGMLINTAANLEQVDQDWGNQLSMYGWLCGADVGDEFLVGIDQLVCKKDATPYPTIRVAEHRTKAGRQNQLDLFDRIAHCWDVISSDHIFRDLTPEESANRCLALEAKAKSFRESDPEFLSLMRR